jgi:hypothetical protein
MSVGVGSSRTVELLDESPLGGCSGSSTAVRCGTSVEGLLSVWCVGTLLGPEATPVWCVLWEVIPFLGQMNQTVRVAE